MGAIVALTFSVCAFLFASGEAWAEQPSQPARPPQQITPTTDGGLLPSTSTGEVIPASVTNTPPTAKTPPPTQTPPPTDDPPTTKTPPPTQPPPTSDDPPTAKTPPSSGTPSPSEPPTGDKPPDDSTPPSTEPAPSGQQHSQPETQQPYYRYAPYYYGYATPDEQTSPDDTASGSVPSVPEAVPATTELAPSKSDAGRAFEPNGFAMAVGPWIPASEPFVSQENNPLGVLLPSDAPLPPFLNDRTAGVLAPILLSPSFAAHQSAAALSAVVSAWNPLAEVRAAIGGAAKTLQSATAAISKSLTGWWYSGAPYTKSPSNQPQGGPTGGTHNPVPQPLAPYAPPAGTSSVSTSGGGQAAGGSAPLVLLFVLAAILPVLRGDGRFSRAFCEVPKMSSALLSPLERPG